MKKTILNGLIIGLAISLFSCSSEEDSALLGSWNLVNIENIDCNEFIDRVMVENTAMGVCLTATEGRICQDITITFNDDGTFTAQTISVFDDGGDTLLPELEEGSGTWTQNGNTIESCDSDGDCVNLSLDGNQLILSTNDEDDLFDCRENRLIFEKS